MGYEVRVGTTKTPQKGGAYDSPAVTSAQSSYASLAAQSAADAAMSAEEAAFHANESSNYSDIAAQSALLASQIASVGLNTGDVYDFGLVIDTVIAFPTDFGTIT